MLRALLLLAALPGLAGEVRIAVAANFLPTARLIAADFEAATGHTTRISPGSSGQLYAQIAFGAPYDVFLSADQARPERAEAEGLAVPGSRVTYALGRLALYRREGPVDLARLGREGPVAIANPEVAPYGQAALEALAALDIEADLVRGNSVAQALQFVETGNAALGIVALSLVIGRDRGAWVPLPADLHAPIAQDAVLLTGAADLEAAAAFLAYLTGPARPLIAAAGYDE